MATPRWDCYHVNLQNVGMAPAPSRSDGVLCEPRRLAVSGTAERPGEGVCPYRGLAEMVARGIITPQVGVDGIPVTMDQSVYDSLGAG